ncbi:aspartate/glutamate racemase family protein [Pseudomonas typographi]|uniref:Asp/Glu racemase n=1 Tax=Pseudomonas typographi TaxID=2715964 RepID=A0ABR7Z3N7_9PSED|nr:aspartate/glutamate racemase family protein [Pseudomonas typographi]MBD1552679.1 Asp/Glu racemase [Pseudomonas typographi]MBD1588160.1 Asp/Glu racemase [Pseudomonas typographi]MBD1600131.1 Asp/Glu racemase [Pseudomonas typographi]
MNSVSATATPYDHFGFSMDAGLAARARIGLVVLATDHTLEYEWRHLLTQPGVAFYESRLYNAAEIAPATLAAMEQDIRPAVELILPGIDLQVVAFGCTSGTLVIGEGNVFARIREARPGVACTTPLTGAMAALKALGARRIALLTPYVASINQLFAEHIEGAGIQVTRIGSFNHADDNEVARIDHGSLRRAALALGNHAEVDAVFVSCTSLRMASLIPTLERELGKPVISSNYAMAWHALRLAGVHDAQPQLGSLFAQ